MKLHLVPMTGAPASVFADRMFFVLCFCGAVVFPVVWKVTSIKSSLATLLGQWSSLVEGIIYNLLGESMVKS